MIKLFIYSLIAITLALVLTVFLDLPNDPGYLLIAWGNYTFETSLFALSVFVIVFSVLLRLLYLLLQWLNPWHLIRYGRNYNKMRKSKRRSNSLEGLLYFSRGNWQSSFNLLKKGLKDKDASVVNHLACAYAAYEMQQKQMWVQCLDTAEIDYPAAKSTINFLRAQLLFKAGQLEQCLAVLEQLRSSSINDNILMGMLKKVYIKLEDWEQLRAMLPALEKNKKLDPQEIEQIRKRLFMEQLYSLVSPRLGSGDRLLQEGQSKHPQHDSKTLLDTLQKLWKKAPANYKDDAKIVGHYLGLLRQVGADAEAAELIENYSLKHWQDEFALLYSELKLTDSAKHLKKAEAWLSQRADNASLLLSLGRLSLKAELWGKAREYFEASIKISPDPVSFAELQRLLRNLADTKAVEELSHTYAQHIEASLPLLPMPSKLLSND